jgi:type VI secretion system secreted protein Hcp
MAFDCFLKIDGIPGESTDEKHKDWLEPISFRFGVSHQVTGSLSGGGSQFSERANFEMFEIEKVVDASTPKLFLCCKGTPIPKMTFELCRATGEKSTYERIDFENCHVQSFRSTGKPDKNEGLPTEQVCFTFSKKTIEAFKTDHATAKLLGSAGKTFWDQTKNAGG